MATSGIRVAHPQWPVKDEAIKSKKYHWSSPVMEILLSWPPP